MYSVPGDDRDPIAMYKKYAEKRPAVCNSDDSPFYIAPRTTAITGGKCQWFINQKVGAKKLGGILKKMATDAGLNPDKNITNHSARKHLIQKLRNSSIAPTDIMAISGHKNVQSILNYSEISEERQIQCSNLLASVRNPSTGPSATVTQSDSSITVEDPIGTAENRSMDTNHTVSMSQGQVTSDQSRYPTHSSQQIAVQSSSNTLNSLFYGAVLHINNLNVYGNR